MSEQIQEKDRFVLYVVMATVIAVGAIIAVKLSENDKFEPIKNQLEEERRLMNIRVIGERGE